MASLHYSPYSATQEPWTESDSSSGSATDIDSQTIPVILPISAVSAQNNKDVPVETQYPGRAYRPQRSASLQSTDSRPDSTWDWEYVMASETTSYLKRRFGKGTDIHRQLQNDFEEQLINIAESRGLKIATAVKSQPPRESLTKSEFVRIGKLLLEMADPPFIPVKFLNLLFKIIRLREKDNWWHLECKTHQRRANISHQDFIEVLTSLADLLTETREHWKALHSP